MYSSFKEVCELIALKGGRTNKVIHMSRKRALTFINTKPVLWEVWVEGYSATGEYSSAEREGSYLATNFTGACEMADLELFNSEKLTVWGCRLFPTELEARKSFG